MAQFDVWKFTSDKSPGPLVVEVQHAMFGTLATRLVVPLYPVEAGKPIQRLNPAVEIGGTKYYLAVQEMAAVRVTSLRNKVASLNDHRHEIIAAIDFLTTAI